MHELAICQAMMQQVESISADNQATHVVSIEIGMGPLSGVEAQLLKHAYPVASAGTIAEGAELIIKILPVRVSCNQCGKESEVPANKLLCNYCDNWQTTLISGDELILLSLEMDKAVH